MAHQWVYQCVVCGRQVRVVKSNAPEVLAISVPVPLWDQALADRWSQRQRALSEARAAAARAEWDHKQRAQQEGREQQQREWWAWYDAYLQTETWQRKRKAVLERDNYLCQACLSQKATQVHHLDYAHVGDEPLFDLVAICGRCHQKLHQQEKKAS